MHSLAQRTTPTTSRRRLRVVAVAVAGLAAAAVPGAASAAAPAVAPVAAVSAVAPAAAPTPLPQLLLTPRDLNGFSYGGNNWGVSSQRLTPATTVERLAGCSGRNTLSPSVARTLQIKDGAGWTPEGPSVYQRVVRYKPGRGDDVIDLFRDTLRRCPVRTFDSGNKERWRVTTNTGTTGTDRLIIRREPLPPATPYRSHIVVTRVQDKVSVIYYDAGHTLTGDAKGASTLATLSSKRLAN